MKLNSPSMLITTAENAFGSVRQIVEQKPSFFRLVALTLVIYAYVLVQLFEAEWSDPESSHGPIVLLLALWLLYRKWDELHVGALVNAKRMTLVFAIFTICAIMYAIGVLGQLSQLAYGSIVPFLFACILLFQNRKLDRRILFPLALVVFSIPLPSFIVDPITLPMKQLVAATCERILSIMGYPVARTGVIIYLWPYQLEVANACSGLRTLFTLEALGLIYLNLVEHNSVVRNVGLAILVVPISFVANAVRVLFLCVITYRLGDAAGQGFLHEFAGLTLFLCAVLLLLASDAMLRAIPHRKPRRFAQR